MLSNSIERIRTYSVKIIQTNSHKRWLALSLLGVCIIGGVVVWYWLSKPPTAVAFASGNGRIEATEVLISTKMAGRLTAVEVKEGDDVDTGQVLAKMDTKVLEADLREAEAAIMQATYKKASAEAAVAQRQNEIAAAQAQVEQRSSQSHLASKEVQRTKKLYAGDYISGGKMDVDQAATETSKALLSAAQAQLLAAQAGVDAAKAGELEAQAAIEAAVARAETIRADIADSTLPAPINGRVLYRLAEPGEVLGVGGHVLTLLDLSDVYMTLFLPTEQAGQTAVGAEARIVLDVRPDLSIPAKVTFVSPQAQFTPKAVETRTEREKLMFRIKVTIPPDLLKAHAHQVKTGLPGVAYVRLDPYSPWPKNIPPLISEKKPSS